MSDSQALLKLGAPGPGCSRRAGGPGTALVLRDLCSALACKVRRWQSFPSMSRAGEQGPPEAVSGLSGDPQSRSVSSSLAAWFRALAAGRVGQFCRRGGDLFPLTRLGIGVVCLGLGGWYWLGRGAGDLMIKLSSVLLLGAAASCLALLLAGCARLIIWRWRSAPERLVAAKVLSVDTATPGPTGLSIPGLRYWPLLELRVRWNYPEGARVSLRAEGGFDHEEVSLRDRGTYPWFERAIELRDVLGIGRVVLRSREDLQLDVMPHRGGLASLPLLRSLSGGDDIPHPMGVAQGDRLDLRRYAPGDPARFIHWKAYARSQKLVVRVPERALSRARRTVAYLVAGELDEASAACARVALESGAFGDDWSFGADGVSGEITRLDDALHAIRDSVAAAGEGAAGLSDFLDQAQRRGPAALVLFVPARAGAWRERLASVIRGLPRPPRVVIGVDAILPETRTGLREWLLRPAAVERAVAFDALREQSLFFEQLGCELMWMDRPGGRVLGAHHLAALGGPATTETTRVPEPAFGEVGP